MANHDGFFCCSVFKNMSLILTNRFKKMHIKFTKFTLSPVSSDRAISIRLPTVVGLLNFSQLQINMI